MNAEWGSAIGRLGWQKKLSRRVRHGCRNGTRATLGKALPTAQKNAYLHRKTWIVVLLKNLILDCAELSRVNILHSFSYRQTRLHTMVFIISSTLELDLSFH